MSHSAASTMAIMAHHAEKRVVETLRGHGALSAGGAVPLVLSRGLERSALRRLLRRAGRQPSHLSRVLRRFKARARARQGAQRQDQTETEQS